jgi:hypothetical protein
MVNGKRWRGKGKERRGELLLPVALMVTTLASLAPVSCEQRDAFAPSGSVLGEEGVVCAEWRGRGGVL